ncbi:hypothetical protein FB554_1250 [Barrientosiimonas humi]|uniref:HNH nuclease domain-containing protein n=1 Tax=Barrientosiimonas humi TaxID=999931 RepID=A0A542XBA1_9MICO|nr:HNH endonuclease signature motif containing protein [Barrientosiimonas humi]TQL33115.1 hypothetical protein FB554_1250 [Barrientosiimonas humi]CAG7573104.1 hypothetical protein BH39T_PBIAJDOK_01729 [Barrientosiimonas humi]
MVDLDAAEHTTGELLAVASAALQAAYTRVSGGIAPEADRSGEGELDPATVLAQVGALHELINTASAVQTHRLAEHAATETHTVYDPESGRSTYTLRKGPTGRVRDTAAADLQGLLALGPVTARRVLAQAVEAVAFFPQLVDAMATGALSRAQVEAVGDALVDVEPAHRRSTAQGVEHQLLLRGIEDLPPSRLGKVAKAAVYAARPEAEPVARERATRDRLGVWFSPGPLPGLSVMNATLRTHDAVTMQQALEALAWRYHTTARKTHHEQQQQDAQQRDARQEQRTGECGCCPRTTHRQPCCASGGFGAVHDADCDPARRAATQAADAAEDVPVGAQGGENPLPKLGECRTDALRDLLMAQASIETTATLLVPIIPFPATPAAEPKPPATQAPAPVAEPQPETQDPSVQKTTAPPETVTPRPATDPSRPPKPVANPTDPPPTWRFGPDAAQAGPPRTGSDRAPATPGSAGVPAVPPGPRELVPRDRVEELLADLPDKVPDRVPTAWMHRVADQLRRAERTRSVVEESLIRLLDHHDIPTDRPDSDPPSSNHAQNLHGLDLAGLDKQAPGPRPSHGPDTRPAPSDAPPKGTAPRDARPSRGPDTRLAPSGAPPAVTGPRGRLTIAHVPGNVLLDLTTTRSPAAATPDRMTRTPDDPGAPAPDHHDDPLPPIREVLHRPGSIDHVQIPGLGVIPADVITAILRAGSLTLRRALLDTTTGALLTGPSPARTPYKPSHALAEAIRLRDGTCRFPGCTRPAEHADIDHVNPYDPDNPDAQTTGSNLQCLCRAHHRAKQSGAWTVTMTPDGICTWTAITGEQRFTYPQHADLLDAPPPF